VDIKNKIAIVTGGAHGIGRALCRAFKNEGASGIVIADLDIVAAEKLAKEIDGIAIACDVSDESAIKNLVTKTHEKYGRVDIFVSNAGVGFGEAPGWTATSASNKNWQACWDVNVMSHVYAARAVLPEMRKRGSGYLLNTASAAGLLAQMGDAAYTATKHAAVAFAKSLAITHGQEGIGVSVLCPQYVATAMIGIPDDSDQTRKPAPLEPEDVAHECIDAIKKQRFMVQPHKAVQKYQQFMIGDYDKWITGMQSLRQNLTANIEPSEYSMDMFIRTKR